MLHYALVPKELFLEELTKVRSKFIISESWGIPETIEQDFIERDNVLKLLGGYGKVISWFDHDL